MKRKYEVVEQAAGTGTATELCRLLGVSRSGFYAYIPRPSASRKKWGEESGYRPYLIERNNEIKLKFKEGSSIPQLAVQYSLSYDTIRKIVYSKEK